MCRNLRARIFRACAKQKKLRRARVAACRGNEKWRLARARVRVDHDDAAHIRARLRRSRSARSSRVGALPPRARSLARPRCRQAPSRSSSSPRNIVMRARASSPPLKAADDKIAAAASSCVIAARFAAAAVFTFGPSLSSCRRRAAFLQKYPDLISYKNLTNNIFCEQQINYDYALKEQKKCANSSSRCCR